MKRLFPAVLAGLLLLFLVACGAKPAPQPSPDADNQNQSVQDVQDQNQSDIQDQTDQKDEKVDLPDEHGSYTSKEDVCAYLVAYGRLPENFITKKEAQKLGWEGGSLEKFAPGKCIGGDKYGNYEKLLPIADGRKYTECDIDTLGASKRGAKRIVFSNDGLIYYTDDHYASFTLLYGEE